MSGDTIFCIFLFILGSIYFFEWVWALIGYIFSKFSYRRHPKLHRFGLSWLSLSCFTYHTALPRRCQMCCGVDKCTNSNCPGQVFYRDAERPM